MVLGRAFKGLLPRPFYTWVSLTHTNAFQSLQVLSNNNYYDDADANDDDDDPWG